jgi:hypothetical protein
MYDCEQLLSWESAMLTTMSVAIEIPNLRRPGRYADRVQLMFPKNSFQNSGDVCGGQYLPAPSGGATINEGLQPKPIKNYSLLQWIIMCGAMLLIALLFGFVPVLISYRKFMGT